MCGGTIYDKMCVYTYIYDYIFTHMDIVWAIFGPIGIYWDSIWVLYTTCICLHIYIYITLFKMTIKHPMNVGVSDMAVLNFGQAFGVSAI